MSWGVATQNGVSVGLTSVVSLSCGATEFSPASLFTSGVAGAWYDPSDYSTLFQDSAGTTPVTAVEQAVRLMLDKSQGLSGSGSQLVTNGDFSSPSTTGWQASGGGSFSVVSNRLQVTAAGATGTGAAYTLTTIVGMTYTVSFDVVLGTAIVADSQMSLSVVAGASIGSSYQYSNVNGTYKYSFVATATTTYFQFHPRGTGNTASVDNFSVISLGVGNHALAPNDPSRPILRARYNLLTYSEQFDNAAWTKNNSTITANTAVAPDGTTTADTMRCVALGSDCWVVLPASPSGIAYTGSCYFKYIDNPWVAFSNSSYFCYFNIQTGTVGTVGNGSATITDVGNGWYRCAWYQTDTTATGPFRIRMAGANGSATTTPANATVFIWGAQNVTGSSAGTYQRIAAATDYATAGFLPYLYFDGSDDYLVIANTNDLNFGQGSFWAQTGLTSLGASQYDVVWGKGSASNDNIRLFLNTTDSLVVFWGNDSQNYTGSTFQITKNTAQIQEWGVNSSGPTAFYALNGTENTLAITLSGTGSNSAPAYIGINYNGAQYQTQMNLYGMILRKGTLPTAAQRTESRNWMAAKSGAVL